MAVVALAMTLAILAPGGARSQSPQANSAMQAVLVSAGRAMIERQIHLSLFMGHHATVAGRMPAYSSSDLLARGWESLLIEKLGEDDASPGESDETVLLVRRSEPRHLNHLERKDCHVLFFHGNNENLAMALDSLETLEEALQCHLYAIEYTGYRTDVSTTPSEAALVEDALTATRWLIDNAEGERVFLYGHSLGAALAVDVASRTVPHAGPTELRFKPKISGVILEAPFLSAIKTVVDYDDEDAVRSVMGAIGARMPMLNDTLSTLSGSFFEPIDKFVNEDKMGAISLDLPIFVGHGKDDAVIPSHHGKALFDLFDGKKKTSVFLESDAHTLHNATDPRSAPFFKALNLFLGEILGESEGGALVVRAQDGQTLRSGPDFETFNTWLERRELGRGAMAPQRDLWDRFLSGKALSVPSPGLVSTPVPSHLRLTGLPIDRPAAQPAKTSDPFGRITATRAPGIDYDPQTKTETAHIKVKIRAGEGAKGHRILAIQGASPVASRASVMHALESAPGEGATAVNRWKTCRFTTAIGSGIGIAGSLVLDEVTSEGVVILPARKCKVSQSFGYQECEEYQYQFLDEATCEVSQPLVAMEALP